VVSTPGVLDALARTEENPFTFLARHQTGDWGDLDDDDKRMNDRSVTQDERILSAYALADGTRIYVITEADRSSTCLLLPEEY
jgi:hypothetical protein